MASWWDDWWGGDVADTIEAAAGVPEVSGAVSGASGAVSAINDGLSFSKAVWLNVSDYRMWRSLGWLFLGVMMMVIGVVLWMRKAVPSVAGMPL